MRLLIVLCVVLWSSVASALTMSVSGTLNIEGGPGQTFDTFVPVLSCPLCPQPTFHMGNDFLLVSAANNIGGTFRLANRTTDATLFSGLVTERTLTPGLNMFFPDHLSLAFTGAFSPDVFGTDHQWSGLLLADVASSRFTRGGSWSITASVVPEPSTLLLMAPFAWLLYRRFINCSP